MITILSRSETVCRLIKLRKNLDNKDDCSPIKEEIDRLLLDVIGVSQKNHHKINDILHKAIDNQIKAKTAVVAIHEIIIDNNFNNNKKKKSKNKQLEELYQRGYR